MSTALHGVNIPCGINIPCRHNRSGFCLWAHIVNVTGGLGARITRPGVIALIERYLGVCSFNRVVIEKDPGIWLLRAWLFLRLFGALDRKSPCVSRSKWPGRRDRGGAARTVRPNANARCSCIGVSLPAFSAYGSSLNYRAEISSRLNVVKLPLRRWNIFAFLGMLSTRPPATSP